MNMSRAGVLMVGTALASIQAVQGASTDRPNVLVILSDDAGYADFGMHGSKLMSTPNIDRLAASGVRFTQGYVSSSVCAPSRMGLMTGRYQGRFGCEHNLPNRSVLGLSQDEVTIPQFLKKAGYYSYALGKWHMGQTEGYYPTERGFDHFFGFLGGERIYFKSERIGGAQETWRMREDETAIPDEDWYLTDALATRAAKWIRDHHEQHEDQPFFMYLAFNAVHAPLQADDESLAEIASLGIEDEKRRTMAAMILSLDRNIGRVLKTLDETGMADNTMVVYLNDNGGPTWEGAVNTPLRGGKSSFFEGGIRVPFVVKWPGHIPAGQVLDTPVISLDLFPTFADVVGLDIPANLDGKSLMPLMTGKAAGPLHDEMFWRTNGSKGDAALRKGDWKIYRMNSYDKMFLFNLSDDPYETTNLATSHPEKMKEMLARLAVWEGKMQEPKYWWSQEFYEKYRTENTPEPR